MSRSFSASTARAWGTFLRAHLHELAVEQLDALVLVESALLDEQVVLDAPQGPDCDV